MKRILIAGCGDIGTLLGQQLSTEGHMVWGLRRQPATLPGSIKPVAADLTASDLPDHLPQQITDVIYTAGATERTDQAYAQAYVKGLDNLLNALASQKHPIQRVLFTSSTAVYGQSEGQWVDEDAPTEPSGFAGRRLLEAEMKLRHGPYPATILRFAGIYGPNRTRLLSRLCRGEARCPLTTRYTNRIHRDDCAAALWHVWNLRHPDPIYIATDHDPADSRDVMRWLANALNVPLECEKPTSDHPSHALDRNKRCRNDRLVRSGFCFRFPTYREGYGPIVRNFRNTG